MRLLLKGLQPGDDYAVQVRANTGDAVSAWSPKLEFTATVNGSVPSQVQNVSVRAVGGDTFIATWDDVTTRVNGKPLKKLGHYVVRVSTDQMPHISKTKNFRVEDNEFTFTYAMNQDVFAPTGASRVGFEVRAVDTSARAGAWSEPIVYGEMNKPDPPIIDECVGIVDGIDIKWHSDDPTVTKYRIYVSDAAGFTPDINNMVWEGDATAYTYMTSTYFEHHIAVTALNDLGVESDPAYATATPISPFVYDNDPPEVPTGLTAARETDKTKVNVSWAAPAEDESRAGYNIMYIPTDDLPADPINDPWVGAGMVDAPADQTSKIVEGLDAYKGYTFRVRAYDTYANYSDWSATTAVAAEDNPIPGAVTGVTLNASDTEPTISVVWDVHPDTDIKQYQVQIDRVNTFNGPFLRNYYTASNSQVITGLEAGIAYYVRVRAIDTANQDGTWSATASISANEFNPTDGVAPTAAPVISVGTPLPGGAIHVFWDAIANNDPVTYEVHVGTAAAFATSSATLFEETSSTSSVVTGGAYDVARYIKVIPKDADGEGPVSNEVSATPTKVADTDIVSLGVGKLTSGTIDTASLVIDVNGEIKSQDYNATNKTGWLINKDGITLYEGSVSASALIAGTISGTTINVGAGGVLNVDSTAVIKSSNYAAGTAGWQLGSTGLEINSGSISANLITGGTFDAGIIYVSSGGGIYDANGYWSITPSSINISQGSINAAAITSGVLRSNAYALNADGSTNFNYWAWQIDKDGDAVFGNTYVRGRLIVDSGVIQSSYYFPGSSGWRIDSGGQVYFNQATINAGLFKSQGSGTRVEIGNTGAGDWVDEVRMFSSGGTVSSIRNPSHAPGTVFMSFGGGGTMTFGRNSSDNALFITMGAQGMIKYTTGGQLQSRNSSDSNYSDIAGLNVKATNQLESNNGITAQSEYVNFPGLLTAGTANVNITAGGKLRFASSSKRFKENIIDSDISTEEVLALRPVKYQRNDELDQNDQKLPVDENSPWEFGFIAEEAHDLGLTPWVNYDLEGKPLGFKYDLFASAHQVVLREHQARIAELEERLAALEGK